eukprot:4174556-Prymnesium_polylepis.2
MTFGRRWWRCDGARVAVPGRDDFPLSLICAVACHAPRRATARMIHEACGVRGDWSFDRGAWGECFSIDSTVHKGWRAPISYLHAYRDLLESPRGRVHSKP